MATKPNTNELRTQDINAKTIQRSTLILSIALTFFATLAAATVANWFVYNNIQSEARANVVESIQLVSKEAK